MNNTTTTESAACVLHQLERNRYFYGKLMTVRDFDTEQRYVRAHRHLHNQSLHGSGVVCGLTVVPKGGVGNETKVVVQPGVALDCCGREIVVAKEQELDLKNFLNIGMVDATGKTVYLCVRYDECKREPVPALANVSTCEEVCDYNRIQEGATFDILTTLPAPTPSKACETWMNLTIVRANIEEGGVVIGEFERVAPRWVRQGDVFAVRRQITPIATGLTIHVIDTLPAGFKLVDGSLAMGVTHTIEGQVIHSTYLVEVGNTVTPAAGYAITGQVLVSPPDALAASTLEVISSAEQLEAHLQRAWFTQEFQECPRCAEEDPSHCVILASITLQQQGTSFIVRPTSDAIDNVIFDAPSGMHRQLVYPMPLVVQLLECLQHDPRLSDAREPLPHAITHQDGGTDEINVTNLSGVLADAQKVTVQSAGNTVAPRPRLRLNFLGGVSVSDDADNDRVDINVTGGPAAPSARTGRVEVHTDGGSGSLRVQTGFAHSLFCVYLGADFGDSVDYGPTIQRFAGQQVLTLRARVYQSPTNLVGQFDILLSTTMTSPSTVPIRWFAIPGVPVA